MDKPTFKKELFEWVKALGLALIIAWGVRYFIFTPIEVNGASMMPTFENGERVIVNKIGPKLTEYERFDIVVFKATEEKNYIKRVIGLPGDHIEYINDVLYVNGEKVNEPYLEEYKMDLNDHLPLTEDFTLKEYLNESVVPEGHLFVLGDNRRKSLDSRDPEVGFVSIDKVLGSTNVVVWPMSNLRIIND